MLEVLKSIGKTLMAELSGMRRGGGAPLHRGASGDRTYAIDKAAEDIVLSGLEASGEPLSVISEEAGSVELNGGGRTVAIDPVDGSRNAVTGLPLYCTSIAVSSGRTLGEAELAYVINLVNGDEYWAARGSGAFVNGDPASTQADGLLRAALYEAQVPARDIRAVLPLISRFGRTRCLGAVAMDLALVAQGSVSLFVTTAPSRSFDFAAGWLLVREAGGVVTDLEGRDISGVELGLERSTALLASGNRRIHDAALSMLRDGPAAG